MPQTLHPSTQICVSLVAVESDHFRQKIQGFDVDSPLKPRMATVAVPACGGLLIHFYCSLCGWHLCQIRGEFVRFMFRPLRVVGLERDVCLVSLFMSVTLSLHSVESTWDPASFVSVPETS